MTIETHKGDFMKERNDSHKAEFLDRQKAIIKTSVIGIATNVFLAVFKAVIGVLSNSIAMMLDAVNNISDALSSVITIIGTKLGGKKPDKTLRFRRNSPNRSIGRYGNRRSMRG